MSCAKCRQSVPSESDTWCLGCSAWEALGTELCARWYSPGLRSLANQQVVSAVKSIRALRTFSSGLHRAGASQAAVASRRSVPAPERDNRAPLPRSREQEEPKGSVVKEAPESYEHTDGESEESSEPPGCAPKSNLARRPAEPANPPIGPRSLLRVTLDLEKQKNLVDARSLRR